MSEQDKDKTNPSNNNDTNDVPEVEAELVEEQISLVVPTVPMEKPEPPPLPSTEHLPPLSIPPEDEIKINRISDFEPIVRRLIEIQTRRVFDKVESEFERGVQDRTTSADIKTVAEMIKLYKDISTPVDEVNIKATGQGGRNVLAKLFDEILNKKDNKS